MDNPFSSPQVAAVADPRDFASLSADRERLAKIGEVFVAWEWLRIWYNAILACVALVAMLIFELEMLYHYAGVEQLTVAAILANVCFCVGTFIEGYVTWWFGPAPRLRKIIFIILTLGANLLTVGMIGLMSSFININ